jgi:3-oxoadipate enol-lactonase
MRGCGRSDRPPRDSEIHPETLIGDVLRVMDAQGLERVHWVGESSGGVLGVLLAAAYPERVASLVLVNTPVRVLANEAINYTAAAFERRSLSDTFKEFGVAEWCRRTLGQRLDLDHAGPELREFFITEMGQTPDYVAVAIHDCIEPIDTLPLLKGLSIPVLLLAGDKKKVTVEQQRIMVREIPHVQATTFEGYGNAIGVLAPERCAREAIKLWESIDPTGAPRLN